MQSATEKKLNAVEEKLNKLKGLGKEIKRLDKELAGLRKRIDAPKDWRNMVGRLAENKLHREADELGREFRRNQPEP